MRHEQDETAQILGEIRDAIVAMGADISELRDLLTDELLVDEDSPPEKEERKRTLHEIERDWHGGINIGNLYRR